jgi:porin
VYVLGNYGKPPSELTGELQTLSNIEAENNLKIYELLYQHSFADDAVKLLVGLHDYNSTFYTLDTASLFSLSSLGIGPDIAQITPSIFPTTATAIHLTLSHEDQYFLLAVYDGIPGDPSHPHGTHIKFGKNDGLLTAEEWGFASEKNYKIALGGWQHTAEVENPIDGSLNKSNNGYYLIGEKYLTESFSVFFQYGHADGKKNQLETYVGLGMTYKNLWVDEDSIGVGYARAENSSAFLAVNSDLLSAETVVELTYYRPLMEKVSVQTSLYSVMHPGMSPDLDNSLALGLRLYIEF